LKSKGQRTQSVGWVAPYMGAWIEIFNALSNNSFSNLVFD